MSEQQANSDSSDAAAPSRPVRANADVPREASVTESKAEPASEAAASGSSATGTAPSAESTDAARPANIVLYSPARAKVEAERAARANAKAFNTRARLVNRKVSRMVAVAAIAAAIGSLSGALATLGVTHVVQRNAPAVATADDTGVIKAAMLQLETQLAAMKVNIDHATKVSAKTGERVDGFGGRIEAMEKTQAEANLKIARVAEVQDKVRVAAASTASAPAPASPTIAAPSTTAANAPPHLPAGQVAQLPAQPEATGSIANATSEVKPKGDLKADYKATTPIVDGWVLTSVGRRGNAIVASRNGYYEVYPGDPLPGVGRVQDIRYQDGRWVVITPKGLIVRR